MRSSRADGHSPAYDSPLHQPGDGGTRDRRSGIPRGAARSLGLDHAIALETAMTPAQLTITRRFAEALAVLDANAALKLAHA